MENGTHMFFFHFHVIDTGHFQYVFFEVFYYKIESTKNLVFPINFRTPAPKQCPLKKERRKREENTLQYQQ